ncbi:ABC transporter substrate-binding protein [Salibacterium salarium]|nr:extracellular solute-binding protein [Salibacterium salarium]
MNQKWVLVFSFVFILLAGCAQGAGEDENEEESNDAETTLTFWNRLPELESHFQSFIEKFEEEHPDIAINMENLGASGNQQFQTAINNDELPDIFVRANVMPVRQLVEQNQLKNLNEIFTDEIRDNFRDGTWSENFTVLDDDVYQLPLYSGNSSVMMFYNKDVLDTVGMTEEEVPQTWEEMMKVGKKINEQSNGSIYGLTLGAEAGWLSDMFISQMGTSITPSMHTSIDVGKQINYQNGEVDFATDGNIETIEFINDLQDANVLDPQSVENDEPTALANFAAGRAAFFFGGNWTGANLVNEETGAGFENWGVAPMPTKNGDPYYSDSLTTEGLMVSEYTKHWEEVQTFLNYFIEHGYTEVVAASGAHETALATEVSEEEAPFEQYNDITNIMSEHSMQVPDIYKRNINTSGVIQDYHGSLSYSAGEILRGYLQGEIDDLEAELEEATEEGKKSFESALNKSDVVDREDFIFDNWVPFEPYTEADYEELE